MAKTFTKIPANTFKELQLNAGVLTKSFTPGKTATINASAIVCATTGGINFSDTPTYEDLGEGIDNCPANMMELKSLRSHEVKMGGTAVSFSAEFMKTLIGPVTEDTTTTAGVTKLTPLNELKQSDFADIWWVGDYGDGGWAAIHLMNALNTSGFALKTNDNGKGESAFEFTGHYSISAQDTVPYECYLCAGTE